MTEAHTMTVRWAGDGVLAKTLAAAASEQGHASSLEEVAGEMALTVEVVDHDLQTLRDRLRPPAISLRRRGASVSARQRARIGPVGSTGFGSLPGGRRVGERRSDTR